MKKTLLSVFSIVIVLGASAQTYTPSAGSPLANGEVGTAYSQTINAAIPTTVDITGQDIIDVLPAQVAQFAGTAISPTATYTVTVTSTVLTVEGLPTGLTDDCNGCTVLANNDRDIAISGNPTQAGSFVVNIVSATAGQTTVDNLPFVGSVDVPFGGSLTLPTLGSFDIPALPNALDADGYTMNVSSTGIEEHNEYFSTRFYPNPTDGAATLEINSTLAGLVNIEVYSITGAMIKTNTNTVGMGVNRLAVDLSEVPAGIYMIKAVIDGHQTLIRTLKK